MKILLASLILLLCMVSAIAVESGSGVFIPCDEKTCTITVAQGQQLAKHIKSLEEANTKMAAIIDAAQARLNYYRQICGWSA